jgi:hypothetical protein
MKLCFVSVNGPREPYLLDEPRISPKVRQAHHVSRQYEFLYTPYRTNCG